MKKIVLLLPVFLITVFFLNSAHAVCVKVAKANLRTGPSKNYEKAWEVFKYMPFLKVGASNSGSWYAVRDVDGDVNWIHKDLISSKIKCAVVKKAEVNVRTGPGTGYSKSPLSPATQYYSFKVLKRKGKWVRVQDEFGNIGWIHVDYLWIQ
jgi:SH3-like domain-containing protein